MPSLKEMIDHYNKLGIDFPKTKDGNPNMVYKQNRITYNELSKKECIICMDRMIGFAYLDCGHEFCIKCTIKHFRLKDNCPLCRKLVCKKEKSMIDINHITDELLSNEFDSRNNLNMYDFIVDRFKNSTNIEETSFEVLNEIKLTCLDIGVLISE